MLMTLTPFPQLVSYIGFSLTLFTVLVGGFAVRVPARAPEWQRLRALQFAWPLIPASYILVGICMMVYGVIWQPAASLTPWPPVGAGAGVHFGVRARRD